MSSKNLNYAFKKYRFVSVYWDVLKNCFGYDLSQIIHKNAFINSAAGEF